MYNLSTNMQQCTIAHETWNTRLDKTFPPIAPAELENKNKRLEHKAPVPSGITGSQLQHLPDNMMLHLALIYNLSLSIWYFPRIFKHATMMHIPKSGQSQHHIENYRPISLLDTHGTYNTQHQTKPTHHAKKTVTIPVNMGSEDTRYVVTLFTLQSGTLMCTAHVYGPYSVHPR